MPILEDFATAKMRLRARFFINFFGRLKQISLATRNSYRRAIESNLLARPCQRRKHRRLLLSCFQHTHTPHRFVPVSLKRNFFALRHFFSSNKHITYVFPFHSFSFWYHAFFSALQICVMNSLVFNIAVLSRLLILAQAEIYRVRLLPFFGVSIWQKNFW